MQRITKDPEIRRQEIIDAAIRLFIQKGYEQTSMLDITKSINVSQGLCYRYFKSKEEIYQVALDSYVSQGVDYFLSFFEGKKQPLIDIITTMPPLNNATDNSSPYHQFFNSSSKFHLQMELALIERLIPVVAERLEQAKVQGEISIENSLAMASFFLYGQLGVWQICGMENNAKIENIRDYAKKLLEG